MYPVVDIDWPYTIIVTRGCDDAFYVQHMTILSHLIYVQILLYISEGLVRQVINYQRLKTVFILYASEVQLNPILQHLVKQSRYDLGQHRLEVNERVGYLRIIGQTSRDERDLA